MKTYVVAGTYAQFRAWCLDNDVNPRDPQYVWVGDIQKIRGVVRGRVVYSYGCTDLWDWPDIEHRVETVIRPSTSSTDGSTS